MDTETLTDAVKVVLESCIVHLDRFIVAPDSDVAEPAKAMKESLLRAIMRLEARRSDQGEVSRRQAEILERILRYGAITEGARSGDHDALRRIVEERRALRRQLEAVESRAASEVAARHRAEEARGAAERRAEEAEAVAERALAAANAAAQQAALERRARDRPPAEGGEAGETPKPPSTPRRGPRSRKDEAPEAPRGRSV
jgi:peptidoglycan hydrolase CwlO-like protein